MTVAPTDDQLKVFAEGHPDGPIHMLNLLRFRAQAAYPQNSDHNACSGAQAYAHYGKQMLVLLKQIGATVEILGQCQTPLIGEARDTFDHMIIVRYPSRQAMLQMLRSDAYQQVSAHRTAAVEHSLLIPITQFETPLGAQQ